MDFGKALLLVAAVVGIIQLTKTFVWGTTKERINAGIVLGASLIGTFLIAATVWADTQVVNGKQLDQLGVWSKVTVALFVAGVAVAAWEAIPKSIRNIGQNQPQPVAEITAVPFAAPTPAGVPMAAAVPMTGADEEDPYASYAGAHGEG